MATPRNIRTTFLYVSASIVFLASVYHLLFRDVQSVVDVDPLLHHPIVNQLQPLHLLQHQPPSLNNTNNSDDDSSNNRSIIQEHQQQPSISIINTTTTTQSPPYYDPIIIHQEVDQSPPYDPITIHQEVEVPDNTSTNAVIQEENNPIDFNLSNATITIQEENNPIDINPSNTNTSSGILNINPVSESITHNNDTGLIALIPNVSVLFPAWEALVVVPDAGDDDKDPTSYFCLFDMTDTTPARFSGKLQYPYRKTFTCDIPERVRRRLPFRQPLLTKSPEEVKKQYPSQPPAPEMLRWNYIVYDLIETESDFVLFVKGLNNRQGASRKPTEFKCVFGTDEANAVKTPVTSSFQEVFRCQRPDLTALDTSQPIKTTLEISQANQLVPSIAYYAPERKIAKANGPKSLLCACTMVYNVAKFLREWVIYHSKIGVDKFILYDNGSDDDLRSVVDNLNADGYNVSTQFWLWPKTQEAGFSHAALQAKDTCQWMIYIDVDEFFYSPLWVHSRARTRSKDSKDYSNPSKSLLRSFLPHNPSVGQLMIACREFGPSNQKENPPMGVTQGYNCRKKADNRHKSIVLLEAIDHSLLNVIHHFVLKDGYKGKKVGLETAVVNHYKYQAWPEFKAKFRRRVSAYVVDWTMTVNLRSNDRAPGLGNQAVKPKGWEQKFCEVYDNGLRDLTRRWFGREDPGAGLRMAWQR